MKTLATLTLAAVLLVSAGCASSTSPTAAGGGDPITQGAVPGRSSATSIGGGVGGMGGISGAR